MYQMPRGFSSILGSGSLPIQARSVARGLNVAYNDAIILLDPTGQGSLTESGTASINVGSSKVIVDSSSSKAVILSSSASVTAAQISITGNYKTSGSAGFNGTVTTGVSAMADPLASITEPSIGSLATVSSSQYAPSAAAKRPRSTPASTLAASRSAVVHPSCSTPGSTTSTAAA